MITNKNLKDFIYVKKFIFFYIYCTNNNLLNINDIILKITDINFFLYIKIIFILYNDLYYKKINSINLLKFIYLNFDNKFNINRNILKFFFINIKKYSKTTKNNKILSYKIYLLFNSTKDSFFGIGTGKSINMISSIKKAKYNSFNNIIYNNKFIYMIENNTLIKIRNSKIIFLKNNNLNLTVQKNYFNKILIFLNIFKYKTKIKNNNIDNIINIINKCV